MITLHYKNLLEHDLLPPLHYYIKPFKLYKTDVICDGILTPIIIQKVKNKETQLVTASCKNCEQHVKYYISFN